ncbi:MAG: hypothetical protein ABEJ43_01115 [Haloferacaceae archaeon]
MKTSSLDEVPFRLLLVATWAVTWGGAAVYRAVLRLNDASLEFTGLLLAVNAGVIGMALFALAVLLFTPKPVVRKVAVLTFVILAITEAYNATAFDVMALGTIGLHLTAAIILVYTRGYFRSDRVDIPEDGATNFGV